MDTASRGLFSLPLVVLAKIMKFLDPVDCASLSFATDWDSISHFLQNKRIVILKKNYHLKPPLFSLFGHQRNLPHRIKVLDISHCYWVPVDIAVNAILSMLFLEKLYIEDTQITPHHLPSMFQYCKNITHLSISLNQHSQNIENNLTNLSSMATITHLKMVWFDYIEGWKLVLQLLQSCRDCTHLHLVPGYQHCNLSINEVDVISPVVLLKLSWMNNLSSFICFREVSVDFPDPVMEIISLWMATELNLPNIQQFWMSPIVNGEIAIPSTIKSLHVGSPFMRNHALQEFQALTEIGGVYLNSLPRLPNLKLAQGTISGDEDLFRFLERQTTLVHLFVEKDVDLYADFWLEDFPLPDDLQMNQLLTLVYTCCRLDLGLVGKLLEMSPNLEYVAVDCTDPFHWSPLPFEQLAKLEGLKKLFVESDGFGAPNCFHQLFTCCNQLESLHIRRRLSQDSLALLNTLRANLHLATNLRDLSLIWSGDSSLALLTQITEAACECPKLERLHLQLRGAVTNHSGGHKLPELIDRLLQRLPNFVALSLDFNGPSPHIREIHRQMETTITKTVLTSSRLPSFWFRVGHAGDKSLNHAENCSHVIELINHYPQSPINFLLKDI